MATVELKSISELFGLQFFIPSYQRGYRWTTVQVRELLEDLYDFSDDNKREDDDYYCLQPVIVKGRGEQWELVDGQQRLTAIWLLSALYYCSNRDDEINLEHQKYELEYEGKPIFTELFSLISKYVQDDTMPALIKHLDAYKEKSIDSRNLIESIEYIAQFTRKNKRPKGVLAKIFEAINSIKIIWYVLDSDEDPIQTFTNINANKIELTNAELIKAVLLNSCEDNNQMQNMALQWEEIEKGLNDDGLWNFIVSKRRNVFSTRIDYLFEIWCAKTGQVIQTVSDDKHAVFRLINGLLNGNDQKDSADIWKEIQTIYDTLLDWFNDYYYYHTIGLLIIINEKEKDIDIINDLYQIYSSSDKKAFKKEICSKIRNIYFGKTKTTPFEVFEVDQIKNDLGDIEIFGENLYAVHSIEYQRLETHFYVFAVRCMDQWLSWEEVKFYAALFDFPTVPELKIESVSGLTPELLKQEIIRMSQEPAIFGSCEPWTKEVCTREGVVSRNVGEYLVSEFAHNVFKYVRKGHVKTDEHWTRNWKRAPLVWEFNNEKEE